MLFAQTKKEIIDSRQYYYGSGIAFDALEAKQKALDELTQQIAVYVSSSFKRKIIESGQNLDENVHSVLQTHSAALLKDVHTLKDITPDGRIKIFCYLKKEEAKKIFLERKKLIYQMYEVAKENEQNLNYAQALKLYYFSLLLLNSIPDQSISLNGINFTLKIPQKITQIINNIHFTVIKDVIKKHKEREVTLYITSNSQPVSSLDFSFWDGKDQVWVQAKNGLATFQLLGASISLQKIRLNIKYSYFESRNEYAVISDLWNIVKKPIFSSTKVISLTKPSQISSHNFSSNKWKLKLNISSSVPVAQSIMKETIDFLNILVDKNKISIYHKYSNDPFLRKKLIDYIKYNHPTPLDETIEANINKTHSGYELRRIRVLHKYPSINKQSTEYLVLDFNKAGILIDINTSITDNLYEKFVKQSQFAHDWEERQDIIKFIEKYRTAYLTRDIQTVDLLFDEDALILVGRKIMRKKLPDSGIGYQKIGNEPDYEYIKLSKKQYLSRLRNIFTYQKDIFLDFSSFDIIKKNNEKNIYGIEMRQNYHSTTYGDEGYLFLLIDFSGENPLIYVRAWQPNEWDDSSLVRTANFRIKK